MTPPDGYSHGTFAGELAQLLQAQRELAEASFDDTVGGETFRAKLMQRNECLRYFTERWAPE